MKDGNTELALFDTRGAPRVKLFVSDEEPGLTINDADENTLFSFP